MNYIYKTARESELLCSVIEGAWGTIGPHFLNANEDIAKHAGVCRSLVTFSVTAALETILRGKNIGFGDQVIVADWCNPIDPMTTAAVGATPVFAKTNEQKQLSPSALETLVNQNTKAVIADLPDNPAELSAFCKEKGLYFIINLSDSWGVQVDGKAIHTYADAAFVDMSQDCALDLGLAGAIITDNDEDFNLFYAYHNCGRPMGDGCTLSFDEIIGGDLRIAEFQASMIPGRLAQLEEQIAKSGGKGVGKQSVCVNMANAPFFASDYYKKLTGNK